MKRIAFILAIALTTFSHAISQDVRLCDNDDFKRIAWRIISEGNRQYDRSFRNGIKQYADSLETLLRQRSAAHKLMAEDSLEFTADLLKLRGDWHYENGNYNNDSFKEAEQLFCQAIDIYEKNPSLKEDLNTLQQVQRDMAQLKYRLKSYDEALTYTELAYNAYLNAFNNGLFEEGDSAYSIMLDLQGQKAMCLARTNRTDDALRTIDSLIQVFPKDSERYHETLRKKGKILLLTNKSGSKAKALVLYKQYLTWCIGNALSTLGTMTSAEREDYWMRIRPFVADCYQLEETDPAFLYEVTLFAKGILLQLNRLSGHGTASAEALESLKHTWQEIQGSLADDAAAIEFIQYDKGDKQLLGALVLRKKGAPQWVQMMSPEDFFSYRIGGNSTTNAERLNTPKNGFQFPIDRIFEDSELCDQIWNKDLVKAIGNAKRIYLAPDGYLHLFGFEYMDENPLASCDFYRLTSTRRLLEKRRTSTDAMLAVGGVEYLAEKTTEETGNDYVAYNIFRAQMPHFSPLKFSRPECEMTLASRNCPKDTLIAGNDATEQNFISLCSRYSMIYISTHGIFSAAATPQGTDIKPNLSDESLSHSILAFAGIETNLLKEDFPASTKDGILSAREISQMNLSNVDLIILSACQSGLGFITSDGIYGLQRGLKNAGVGSIIASLWEVNDQATFLLLTSLNRYISEGLSYHNAMKKAREALLDDNIDETKRKLLENAPEPIRKMFEEDSDSYENPYYRNAFILIDAIE